MIRQRRGASAVEFVLTLPVLFGIFAAIMEYGWFLLEYNSVIQAVRDGTRLGVATPMDNDPTDTALDRTQTILLGFGIECDTDDGCDLEAAIDTTGSLDILTVTILLEYDPLIGFIPTPEAFSSTFTMAMEEQS